MLKHADIWQAIDRMAARYSMSASGLARRAGLDPTTFNKSKRITSTGKQRWPSTESIAKILEATGASLAEFVGEIGDQSQSVLTRRIPVIGFAKAGHQNTFDETGTPAGAGWSERVIPQINDPRAYALEINGDGLAPVYREGDVLIVSPGAPPRPGDRVVVKSSGGEVMVKELIRQSARTVELAALNRAHPDRSHPDRAHPDRTLDRHEIAWMARIVWVIL
jgi:phage repressor protein C with HTH and peptisase S24 domain